jgi:3'-phosphoadenosine 5'-phosphosulfate sulfotransferase (PAPS reductase)/FAD synthetase
MTRHVVGLSGGKDSTALALLLAEREPREYEYICNETGDELPDMVDHWRKLEELLGKPIIRVRYKFDLYQTIDQMSMLPNVFSRWCTRVLKIEPTIAYFENLPTDSVLYVGLRADQELRKGIYGEDINIRFPLREWGMSEADVWQYLNDRDVTIPARTDCALCPYQRLGEWRDLYFNYPDKYQKGVELEAIHNHTFRSPGRDTWPADLATLGEEFKRGRKLREYKKRETCRVCSL